jgi:uncharacterized protein (DUF58 family)
VGLFTFDEQVREYLPPRHRHGHLRQLMLALERRPEGRRARTWPIPCDRAAELARKRGLIVFISDLLAPIGGLERHFARLAAAGQEVIVFQVLDPNELAFDFPRAMLFQDLENRRDVYLDPAAARAAYQEGLRRHGEAVEGICRNFGFAFHQVLTNRPLELALLDFLRSRSRRGKQVRRRTQGASSA